MNGPCAAFSIQNYTRDAAIARLFEARKMKLEVTPAAKDRIINEGFDPQFGARPMRRAIQRLVQDPLALELLNGAYGPGDTVVADAPPDAPGLSFAKSIALSHQE